MALITEDGTGKVDAESLISVTDADTYFAARGDTVWAALLTAAKEAALRKATDYLVAEYSLRWAGMRVTVTQALDWPRAWVPRRDAPSGYRSSTAYYSSTSVPVVVARACAELAVRASAVALVADVGAQVKSETVGPISVTYADGARQQTHYAIIEAMLAPFLKGMGAIPVVRA